jgi:type I restriction enzyme S subunit
MTSVRLSERSQQASDLITALGVSIAARPDLSDSTRAESGWRRVALGSVLEPASDPVVVDATGSYPNLGIYGFGRGLFAKPDIDGGVTSARTLNRVRGGQFIYSRLFAFEGAYAYVTPDFDGRFVSNEFPTFDVDGAALDVRWLANYLRSRDRWLELASSSKGLGVRRQRVPVESLLAYQVWLPSIEQQREMVRTIDRLQTVGAARRRSDQRIKALLPAALNAAFAPMS